ncbi:hypothetical protein ACO22_06486 [Paracoccidioides brasiliensis]|uniref:Uncharacterized protein n=1 Tax=Paracoccidioides brasiliensis TaxID=121759 RepID=A0A1D2J7M8_PARBR|nr:hypothetical protein ACO22_06486 [Paracoccidioides brasiliensis]
MVVVDPSAAEAGVTVLVVVSNWDISRPQKVANRWLNTVNPGHEQVSNIDGWGMVIRDRAQSHRTLTKQDWKSAGTYKSIKDSPRLTEAKAPDSRSKHNYDTITSEALVGLRFPRNRLEKSKNSARSYNQWKADILETSQFASDGGVETSRQTNYKSKDVQSDRPKAISPSQPSLEVSQSSAKMHPHGRASLQAFSPMNSNSLLTAWVSVVTLHKVLEEAKFSPPPAWK